MLKERIARKDELLQGYEKDLAKLRQAEKLVEQKHLQVESLSVSYSIPVGMELFAPLGLLAVETFHTHVNKPL